MKIMIRCWILLLLMYIGMIVYYKKIDNDMNNDFNEYCKGDRYCELRLNSYYVKYSKDSKLVYKIYEKCKDVVYNSSECIENILPH